MKKITYNGAPPITIGRKSMKTGDTVEVDEASAKELLAYPNEIWTEAKASKPKEKKT